MRFFLELERCPSCGERDIGEPRTTGGLFEVPGREQRVDGDIFYVTCPRCGHARNGLFFNLDNFKSPAHLHLGDARPSQIIYPHQFAKELAWCLEGVERDLSKYAAMDEPQLDHNNDRWVIGETCINELEKFMPPGADDVPATAFTTDEGRAYYALHPAQFVRANLEAARTLLVAIRAEIVRVAEAQRAARVASGKVTPPTPLPLPPFSLAALKFHEAWLAEGDGPNAQRMTGAGIDLHNRNLVGRDLSKSAFENITLDGADLTRSKWRGAHLVQANGYGASWTSARLTGATFERCVFAKAHMVDTYLFDSLFTQCRFVGADLTRTLWFRSTLTGCYFLLRTQLVDASLDGATFTDCDLRGTDLSVTRDGPIGTTVGTRFIRCDLRDTIWEGRDLFRTSFVDCKLAGARGLARLKETVLERIDLSPGGDGSRIASRGELLQAWYTKDAPADEQVYELPPDDASRLAEVARAHGWSARIWVVTHEDGYRHWVRVRANGIDPTAIATTLARETTFEPKGQ